MGNVCDGLLNVYSPKFDLLSLTQSFDSRLVETVGRKEIRGRRGQVRDRILDCTHTDPRTRFLSEICVICFGFNVHTLRMSLVPLGISFRWL